MLLTADLHQFGKVFYPQMFSHSLNRTTTTFGRIYDRLSFRISSDFLPFLFIHSLERKRCLLSCWKKAVVGFSYHL